MQTKITPSVVQNIKPQEKTFRVCDTLLKGLAIIVHPSGKKVWYINYRRPNGKRTDHMIGAANLFTVTEARDQARDFLAAVARGEDPQKANADVHVEVQERPVTLREFIHDSYAPWVIGNRKTGNETITMILRAFESLLDTDVTKFTPALLEQWRMQQKKQRNVKASSLNRETTALKAALNWGITMEIIDKVSLTKFKQLKEVDSRKIVRYLSDDERSRLMKALDEREVKLRQDRQSYNEWLKARGHSTLPTPKYYSDHLKPMVIVSLNTGIRQNALFSLEWGDVNFDNETIFLRADTAKSSKESYVPMNDIVLDVLRLWHEQSKSTKANDLVFPSPINGKKLESCRKAWKTILKNAEIENFRWHDMRHDFASQLVMRGIDLNTVRELLGHADLKMTLRYAHLAPEAKKKAVDALKFNRKIA